MNRVLDESSTLLNRCIATDVLIVANWSREVYIWSCGSISQKRSMYFGWWLRMVMCYSKCDQHVSSSPSRRDRPPPSWYCFWGSSSWGTTGHYDEFPLSILPTVNILTLDCGYLGLCCWATDRQSKAYPCQIHVIFPFIVCCNVSQYLGFTGRSPGFGLRQWCCGMNAAFFSDQGEQCGIYLRRKSDAWLERGLVNGFESYFRWLSIVWGGGKVPRMGTEGAIIPFVVRKTYTFIAQVRHHNHDHRVRTSHHWELYIWY